ncbi:MAG: hypothetical protein RRC34_01440 [Lentisphaeria bacterium]|nr:hypothetical protein [Lentisphaeria bacterium]
MAKRSDMTPVSGGIAPDPFPPSDSERLKDGLRADRPARGAVSLSPACKWDFGTVVGNGVQGALAFCRTRHEELVSRHEELFLPHMFENPVG